MALAVLARDKKERIGKEDTIIATVYKDSLPENAEEVKKQGGHVVSNIDCTKDSVNLIKKYGNPTDTYFHFPRVPRGKSNKQLIIDYAKESYQSLEEGGRLHLSVPTSATYLKDGGNVKEARATRNKIYGRDTLDQISKLGFSFSGEIRDPQEQFKEFGYAHRMTGTSNSHSSLVGRQLVFKKCAKSQNIDRNEEWSDSERKINEDSDF